MAPNPLLMIMSRAPSSKTFRQTLDVLFYDVLYNVKLALAESDMATWL